MLGVLLFSNNSGPQFESWPKMPCGRSMRQTDPRLYRLQLPGNLPTETQLADRSLRFGSTDLYNLVFSTAVMTKVISFKLE